MMLKKMSLQLYKKMQKETAQTQCLSRFILAGVEGLEPSRTVLETGMLPLHHTPKERHIKFLLCNICNIGTRLWRQCHIKRTVQIVPTAPPFVALGLLNLMPFDALLMLYEYLIKFDAQLPKNQHT